ncbi:MAG: superinfection immunity protein [Mameliella sp.]|nr:superinfection immunity protein [Mameliella sp.]
MEALTILIAVYMLPTFVGAARGARNMGAIVVINLLLGWTLLGWVVALAMAVADTGSKSNEPRN